MIPAVTPELRSGSASISSDSSVSRPVWRWTFFTLAAALLPIMLLSSLDFGVTWDEKDRHKNGELVWQFLRGLRSRSSFAETGGHVYPGLFDVICAALETWVPVDRYVLRHMVNATFGWVGIVYCGRLAARLFGPWSGTLAIVLLALSPRFFADAMNNPKDLPFAAMTVVALFYISAVSPRWPYVTWPAAIKIVISLAIALNIRVGGLLYLGYFGLLVIAVIISERSRDWRRLASITGRVLGMVLCVLLLGTVFWPWAGGAPLTRPFQALVGAANYPWNGLVLFGGHEYRAEELPWYYAPWWFLISTPPAVLLGAGLSPFVLRSRAEASRTAALWAVAIFPLVVSIVMGSTLYDGVRHLEFIYPVLVVLAAAGWTGLMRAPLAPALRRIAGGGLAAGLLSMLIFDVRFHPNQGVYFNALVGGPRGAFARYDMDYWGNCVLQAVQWGVDTARASGIPITVSGNPAHLVQLNAARFHEVRFTHPARSRHYVNVSLARGPIASLRKLDSEPALYKVRTADGVVLCAVTPGPAYGELEALRSRAGSRPSTRQPKPQ
jgi:hypothetical protein